MDNEPNIDNDLEQEEDIVFPIDSLGGNSTFNDANEEDNGINDRTDININNINLPANETTTDNVSNSKNNTAPTYY